MKRAFPLITNEKQKEFEIKIENGTLQDTVLNLEVPVICGYYGRACRQMNKEEGANRALCMDCPLAKYCEE